MNKKEFHIFVQDECKKNNVNFITNDLDEILTVVAKQLCSGFFEENESTLATLGIAGGVEEHIYFEILSHEYSHLQQFLEKDPVWINAKLTATEIIYYGQILNQDINGFEAGDAFQLWIDGKLEIPFPKLQALVQRITDVEFDCELRTVELINRLKLEVDTQVYAQKSNAYLAAYLFALEERKWPRKTSLIKEVYGQMPMVINPNLKMTQEIKELIYLHCEMNLVSF